MKKWLFEIYYFDELIKHQWENEWIIIRQKGNGCCDEAKGSLIQVVNKAGPPSFSIMPSNFL